LPGALRRRARLPSSDSAGEQDKRPAFRRAGRAQGRLHGFLAPVAFPACGP